MAVDVDVQIQALTKMHCSTEKSLSLVLVKGLSTIEAAALVKSQEYRLSKLEFCYSLCLFLIKCLIEQLALSDDLILL